MNAHQVTPLLTTLRSKVGALAFSASTLEDLGWRYVQERLDVLPSESVSSPQALELPMAKEALHLCKPRHESPAGRLSLCSGLLHYPHLNSIFAGRRTLVLDADNTHEEQSRERLPAKYYWRPRYSMPIRVVPAHAMVFRSAANNYYHTLIDNLPRLLALHHPRLQDTEIQLLISRPLQDAEQYFLHKVLPPNVRLVMVERHLLHLPDTLVLPSFLSRQMSGFLPRAWLDFFRPRVLPNRERKKNQRIYISRRQSRVGRCIVNESELVAMLSTFGFKTVDLESLPIAAQIELFFDAELVVGAHGAGLTNLLFAEGATVIELHPASRVMPHFYFLCLALGHNYRFLCGNGAGRNDNFAVDIEAIRNHLLDRT